MSKRIGMSLCWFSIVLGSLWSSADARSPFGFIPGTRPRPFRRDITDGDTNWTLITPSEILNWTACDEGFQCARLSVPLDYNTPNGPQTQIALQLSPAANNSASKGTILVNPGGPGGSGTQFVSLSLQQIRNFTGLDFALLGFDPRGTGASTTTAQCFQSDSQYGVWNALSSDVPLNASDGSVPAARSRAKVLAQLCQSAIGGNGKDEVNGTAEDWGIGRFMDTASVARDMVTIIDKLGQDKLLYYGVSYGTHLGQYFATLFPDRVGRMVLDGVVDADAQQALQLIGNVQSTDAVAASFSSFCYASGPSNCSMHDSSADAIYARYTNVLQTVAAEPIPLPFGPYGPTTLDSTFVGTMLFTSLYDPGQTFSELSDLFLAVESTNTSELERQVQQDQRQGLYVCSSDGDTACTGSSSCPNQAETVVECTDAPPTNDTASEFATFLQNITAASSIGGSRWAQYRLQCEEWLVPAKSRFSGKVGSNTSTPILFVSSRYDPVCPLMWAQGATAKFPGSALLVQDSFGHSATGLQGTTSSCTTGYIYQYLLDGTLPANGTVCPPAMQPFGVPGNVAVTLPSTSASVTIDRRAQLSDGRYITMISLICTVYGLFLTTVL